MDELLRGTRRIVAYGLVVALAVLSFLAGWSMPR